jgi:hypothetical protein
MRIPITNEIGTMAVLATPLILMLFLAMLAMALIDRLLAGREADPD